MKLIPVSNQLKKATSRLHIILGVHSWLGYYFWDKETKEYVALDLNVLYDLLLLLNW